MSTERRTSTLDSARFCSPAFAETRTLRATYVGLRNIYSPSRCPELHEDQSDVPKAAEMIKGCTRQSPFVSVSPERFNGLAFEPLPVPHGRCPDQTHRISGSTQSFLSLRSGVGVETSGLVKAFDNSVVRPESTVVVGVVLAFSVFASLDNMMIGLSLPF